MTGYMLKVGLLFGALGVSTLAGCSTVGRSPVRGPELPTFARAAERPGPAQPYASASAAKAPAPQVVQVTQTTVGELPVPPDVTLPPPPDLAPPVTTATVQFEGTPEPVETVVTPHTAVATTAEPSFPVEVRSPFPRGEGGPARRSFVDLSASPCFGHAPDYSWISGQVEYSRVAKEWRLRYASVDEADQYGGRVVLIENHHMTLLQDGQCVRAQGHLVNADPAGGAAPHYRIESFQAVEGER